MPRALHLYITRCQEGKRHFYQGTLVFLAFNSQMIVLAIVALTTIN